MDRTDHRRVAFTTLSPVHIGCDEDYLPTNFVIKNDLLHCLDIDAIADSMDDSERSSLGRAQTIGHIQQFFKSRSERFSLLATHTVEMAPDIAKEYEEKAGHPTQQTNRESIYNQLRMMRTAYRQIDFAPYLPGSSIKGSIRTAWLDRLNNGRSLEQLGIASKDKKQQNRELQQKLLGYSAGKFENDPLRHLRVSDAHHEDASNAVPTRILYAISKKKKPTANIGTELPTYLETIPGLIDHAFTCEIVLTDTDRAIAWQQLCEACNAFYWPQLEMELEHSHLGRMLNEKWRGIVRSMLADEFQVMREKHQGFLLRVGKHSGAEAVTLNGVRRIEIKGPRGTPATYRSQTTEKRLASATKAAASGLLPFGWIWVESCQDESQWISESIREKLRPFSQPVRDAQRHRLYQIEEARQARISAEREAEQRRKEAEEAQRKKEQEDQLRQAKLDAMSPNLRKIAELQAEIEKRLKSGVKLEVGDSFYGQHIQRLADLALVDTSWSVEEKHVLADMLQDKAGKLMKLDAKELRKRLKLTALRGQA